MDTLITPPYLKKGDALGIVAPSRSVTEMEIAPFAELMHQNGYRLIFGKNLFGKDRQFSGTVEQRLNDLHQLITNPKVKAIFPARGGYGAAQLLPGIDWEIVRENPKWLVGFSDVTALHSAFGAFMETIHGVMPFSLLMDEVQDQDSFNQLLDVLKGVRKDYPLRDHELNVSGSATGSLTGGNLSLLYSLAGTPFEPDYEGKILFLEDLDEYTYHIDRMILNFELRGIFNKIAGLVIGDFSGMHDNKRSFGRSALEIIAERAVKYKIPTQFGFPSGHKKMNFPLIFGRVSTLTVKEGENSLRMY